VAAPSYTIKIKRGPKTDPCATPCFISQKEGMLGSCWGNQREGDHWGDLSVDGWIILGWISRRWDVSIWPGLGWPRIETGGGHL